MATLPLNDRVCGPFVASLGQRDFPSDFPAVLHEAVRVRRVRSALVDILLAGVDFTIVDDDGASFTARLIVAAFAGDVYHLYSVLPPERDRAHAPGGVLRTEILEADAVSAQAQLQEVRRDIGRALLAPMGDSLGEVPPAASRAGKAAWFDVLGRLTAIAGVIPQLGVSVTSAVLLGLQYFQDWRILLGVDYFTRPEYFGAKGDAVELSDAAMTAGSAVLTTARVFTAADVGKLIFVRGAGAAAPNDTDTTSDPSGHPTGWPQIPYTLQTTIASVSGGVATLAAPAATTAAAQQAIFGSDDWPAFLLTFAAVENAEAGSIRLKNGRGYLWDFRAMPNGGLGYLFDTGPLSLTLDCNNATIFIPHDPRVTIAPPFYGKTFYPLQFKRFRSFTVLKHRVVAFEDTSIDDFRRGVTFCQFIGEGQFTYDTLSQRGGREAYSTVFEPGYGGADISTLHAYGPARLDNIAYGISGYSEQGVMGGDVRADGCHRSFFHNNEKNASARIISLNHKADNLILIAASLTGLNDNPWLDNCSYDYSSPSRTNGKPVGGWHVGLTLRTDGNGVPAEVRNLVTRVNVNATNQPYVVRTYRQFWTGGAYPIGGYVADAAGGRAHKVDGWTISGKVYGAEAGKQTMALFGDGLGTGDFHSTDIVRRVRISDLTVEGDPTSSIDIYGAAFKTPLVLENIYSQGRLNLFNFAPGMVHYRNCSFANFKSDYDNIPATLQQDATGATVNLGTGGNIEVDFHVTDDLVTVEGNIAFGSTAATFPDGASPFSIRLPAGYQFTPRRNTRGGVTANVYVQGVSQGAFPGYIDSSGRIYFYQANGGKFGNAAPAGGSWPTGSYIEFSAVFRI